MMGDLLHRLVDQRGAPQESVEVQVTECLLLRPSNAILEASDYLSSLSLQMVSFFRSFTGFVKEKLETNFGRKDGSSINLCMVDCGIAII